MVTKSENGNLGRFVTESVDTWFGRVDIGVLDYQGDPIPLHVPVKADWRVIDWMEYSDGIKTLDLVSKDNQYLRRIHIDPNGEVSDDNVYDNKETIG